jgi:hypothetical protein
VAHLTLAVDLTSRGRRWTSGGAKGNPSALVITRRRGRRGTEAGAREVQLVQRLHCFPATASLTLDCITPSTTYSLASHPIPSIYRYPPIPTFPHSSSKNFFASSSSRDPIRSTYSHQFFYPFVLSFQSSDQTEARPVLHFTLRIASHHPQ